MNIEITSVGFLKRYMPQPMVVPYAEWRGRSLESLLAGLGIPANLSLSILVNGEKQRRDYLLQGGEKIRLVPILVGG
jgi:hypothetical protein